MSKPPIPPFASEPPPFLGRVGASEEAGREGFIPELRTLAGGEPPTRVVACPPFFLRVHPERWTVCADQVVPEFGRLVVQAGVNGASDLGGRLDVNDARGNAERKDWRIIPVDAVPPEHVPAGQRPSYLYRPKGRPDVHLLIYTKCYPGSDRIEQDTAGYLRFCAYLQERGYIERPRLYALRKLNDKLVHQHAELSSKAAEHPAYAGALALATRQLAVVQAAIEAREAEGPESPASGAGDALDMPVLG